MIRARRTAVFAVASIVIGAGAPAAATAKTVGNGANGKAVAVTQGKSLVIKLTPADSGSSGFHWRVATKPAASVLKLRANVSSGARQVFTYKALNPRTTSLALQYVSPGRRARVAKTFRLKVFVAEGPLRTDGCTILNHDGRLIALDSTASVEQVTRSVVRRDAGQLTRFFYDAYYGCDTGKQHVYQLDDGRLSHTVTGTGSDLYLNVTLRGSIVGYVFSKGCPFAVSDGCEGFPPRIESQDLATGKLIRSVRQQTSDQVPGADDIAGFVMTRSGDLAWVEQVFDQAKVVSRPVYRSDLPATSGQAFATDVDQLDADQQNQVDPDSLELDGTDVTWMRGGTLQRAPLR
jgi:hypothetical protein